jgi:hypothetical protein
LRVNDPSGLAHTVTVGDRYPMTSTRWPRLRACRRAASSSDGGAAGLAARAGAAPLDGADLGDVAPAGLLVTTSPVSTATTSTKVRGRLRVRCRIWVLLDQPAQAGTRRPVPQL